jgi:hypothetical protein
VSNPARIGLVLAAVVVAVVLFLVLREDDEEAAPQETAPTEIQETTTEETDTSVGTDTGATTTEEAPTTTEEAPEVARALIVVGPDGPSGVQRIPVGLDQRVEITVRSQIADHVHVHGYDLLADVAPGRPATIRFRATVPGRFEIELEDLGEEIAQLRVSP